MHSSSNTKEKGKRQKSLKEVFKWFDENTTLGGWAPAFHSDNKLSRAFWTILLLIGASLTLWSIWQAFHRYFKYNTVTAIEQDFRDYITLPAVTICNSNRIHCRNLYNVIYRNEQELDKVNIAQHQNLCKLFILSQCAVTLTVWEYRNLEERYWTDVCMDYVHVEPEDPKGYNNLTYSMSPLYYSPEPSSAHDFDRLYLGLDNGTIAEISHHPSAFIKNCTVGGIITSQCRVLMSKGGHRRFLGSTFGLCYTYNLDALAADMKSDYVRRSGEHAGLELLLDTEGDYAMRNTLTKWSGASVTLFQNGGAPDIYGKAISIQPGTETKIGLTKEEHKKDFRKEPYLSKCTEDWAGEFFFDFQPYTTALCAEAIEQMVCMKKCKCMISDKMLNGLVEMDPTKLMWCGPQDSKCVSNAKEGLESGSITPFMKCKPRCTEDVYQTDVSVGSWPNVAYTPKLSELAGVKWKGMNTSYQRFTSMMLKYWIDDNQTMLTQFEIFRSVVTARFATVKIFFKDMTVIKVTQSEEFPDVWSFLGSLGGAMSLYLGTSLIAAFELLEFVFRLILFSFFKDIEKKRPKQESALKE